MMHFRELRDTFAPNLTMTENEAVAWSAHSGVTVAEWLARRLDWRCVKCGHTLTSRRGDDAPLCCARVVRV